MVSWNYCALTHNLQVRLAEHNVISQSIKAKIDIIPQMDTRE